MKKWLVIVAVCLSIGVFAQDLNSIDQYNTKNDIALGSFNYLGMGSTSLTSQLFNTVYFGKSINDELKTDIVNSLAPINRFGFDTRYNAFLSKRVNNLVYFLSYSDIQYGNASINKDAFTLGLYGNKYFEDQTANFSGSNFEYFNYKKIELGIIKNGITYNYGISAAYLNGNNYQKLMVNNASLYTAPYGQYLSANWDIDYYSTNPVQNSNGNGLSFSGYFQKLINENSKATVFFNEIGFIEWKRNFTQYHSSDSLTFSGFELDNKFNIIDTTLVIHSTDELKERYVDSSKTYINSILPAYCGLKYNLQHHPKWSFNGLLQFRYSPIYKPYLNIEEMYHITPKLQAGINLSTGGFSKFAGGIAINYTSERFSVFINSKAINSLVIRNRRIAANINFGLKFSL